MELYEAMRTTFAVRDFRDEPMPDAVLQRILDNARFAASGGNRQGWLVIDVRDSAKRDALVPLIQPAFRRYLAQMQAGESPWNTIRPSQVDAATVAATRIPPGYIERLCHAPRLLMVFVDLAVVASMDQHLERIGVISGASIYPFVWNILLAARRASASQHQAQKRHQRLAEIGHGLAAPSVPHCGWHHSTRTTHEYALHDGRRSTFGREQPDARTFGVKHDLQSLFCPCGRLGLPARCRPSSAGRDHAVPRPVGGRSAHPTLGGGRRGARSQGIHHPLRSSRRSQVAHHCLAAS